MKNKFILMFLTAVVSTSYAQNPSDTLIPWNAKDAVTRGQFGTDDRAEANTKWQFKDYTRATATAVDAKYVKGNKVLAVTHRRNLIAKYGDYPFEGVRFLDQPRPGFCSGFLIAPDILVTAGHCVNDMEKLKNTVWIFDFTNDVPYDPKTYTLTIPESNQFRGVEILDSKFTGVRKEDYCIIRLDRKTGRKPYKFRSGGAVAFNQLVTSIGSPSGLPLKVSDSGRVVNNNIKGCPQAFMHNLDVFGGNSGGPVFNVNGYIEGITVWGPNEDFYFDEKTKTIRQTINNDLLFQYFGIPDNTGNIAYRLLSTNSTLIYSMIHRNLEMAMDDNNLEEFKEWMVYSWIFNEKFTGKDHLLAMAIKKYKFNYANLILGVSSLKINEVDYWGNPLIYVMASNNAVDIFKTAKSNFNDMDVNLMNSYGETALMAAARYGYEDMVRTLLDAGAQAKLKNSDGKTARKLAKKSKHKSVAKMLKNAEKGKSY